METRPIFFERNRVGRVYSGGKLFADFFGDEAEDGFCPEEWIASSVTALNRDIRFQKEGVSKIKGTNTYFDELLKEQPEEMLGSKRRMRILVKVLDSAVRLPAQAHPDKVFSRKHFGSEYGKTECWLVLGTRPEAKIYFGFQKGVDREIFSSVIDRSEYDKNAMEGILCSFEPKQNETYFVPARTVHAIGAGCLILEIQEPTDFTIQPECWCADYRLNDKEMYLGLSKETAMDCFDFGDAPKARLTPKILTEGPTMRIEGIVTSEDTDCFVVNRITLKNGTYSPIVEDSYGVYVVTDGEGELRGKDYVRKISKGEYFFMPAASMGRYEICGDIQIVECY